MILLTNHNTTTMDIITITVMNDVTVDGKDDIQNPDPLKYIATPSDGGFQHITTLNMGKKPAIRSRYRQQCRYIKTYGACVKGKQKEQALECEDEARLTAIDN